MTTNREELRKFDDNDLDVEIATLMIERGWCDETEALPAAREIIGKVVDTSLLSAQETVERLEMENAELQRDRSGLMQVVVSVRAERDTALATVERLEARLIKQDELTASLDNCLAWAKEWKPKCEAALASAEVAGKVLEPFAREFVERHQGGGHHEHDDLLIYGATVITRRDLREAHEFLSGSLRPREANTLTPPPQSGTGRVVGDDEDDSPPDVCAECGAELNGSGQIWCGNCKDDRKRYEVVKP